MIRQSCSSSLSYMKNFSVFVRHVQCEMVGKTVARTIQLGYCFSYNEVQRYKQFLISSDTDVLTSISTEFTQFVSDNVDHNVCTFDGSGTFRVEVVHFVHFIIAFSTNVTESPNEKIQRSVKMSRVRRLLKSI